MNQLTAAERCMVLLSASLEEDPLPERVFRRLAAAVPALGWEENDPAAALTEKTLCHLGLSLGEAEAVLSRLSQDAALDRFLAQLERQGIRVCTRISSGYPARLRERLGRRAPRVLFCAGDLSLCTAEGVSLVGSRKLREPGRRFAAQVGLAAAAERFTYVSGGAAGADSAGFDACMVTGGRAVLFLADNLTAWASRPALQRPLQEGRLLLVSETGAALPFSAQRALSRNWLIHAQGEKVFVAQVRAGTGGTWSGTAENLRHGWSPVFVSVEEPEDPGCLALLDRGATGITVRELTGLRDLVPTGQTRLL